MLKDKREKSRLKKAGLKSLSLLPKREKLKRPSGPAEAKIWLQDLADYLSNLPNCSPRFRFVAYAIKRFLRNSETRDLRKELGLVYAPGRPRTFQQRMTEQDKARKTHNLIRDGQTQAQIANQLDEDPRTVRRRYKKYLPVFKKEEQLSQLDQAMREVLREM